MNNHEDRNLYELEPEIAEIYESEGLEVDFDNGIVGGLWNSQAAHNRINLKLLKYRFPRMQDRYKETAKKTIAQWEERIG